VVALVIAVLYRLFRWAFGRVVAEMTADVWGPRVVGAYSATVIALYALSRATTIVPARWFATPVTATYAHQATLVGGALRASTTLPPSPPMNADLGRVAGADVFLVFVESYGAIAFEKPDVAPRLQPGRAQLATAIRDTGRDVASAFVDSPTFGGSSWLA